MPVHEGLDDSSVSAALARLVGGAIERAGGWIPFSRFMAMALYAPGLGYYASGRTIVGRMPKGGSDFVTAPELSPLFGQALARQLAQALDASGCDEIWEFGAGSGALAVELLAALGDRVRRYSIVELSAPLRERQREATRAFADRVRWLDELPPALRGVVVGNEVLDAMPVELIHFDGVAWRERGVVRAEGGRLRLERSAEHQAAAGRDAVSRRQHDRAARERARVRRDARRPPRARRDLPNRLRLSRSGVLPPAALGRNADVPPRASCRHRSRWSTSA